MRELAVFDPEDAGNVARPPIVCVLGHVDHGKTTLLDALRRTAIADKEVGKITQSIAAFPVKQGDFTATFIDTPGHSAFEKMRERGAKATDVAILVVSASEGVQEQTVEAIRHIRASRVPCIVAITKCDLPNVDVERVKLEVQQEGLVLEEFGGDVQCIQVSATKKTGLSE